MGASLLSLFVSASTCGLGCWTIIDRAHHVLAVVRRDLVRARVVTLDRSIEEAARDLGRVRVDDVLAGHLPDDPARRCSPASLLAFALSIDDFIITSFTSGLHADVPAVDLGRHPDRPAAAGQRHGHADLRGRRPDRRAINSVSPPTSKRPNDVRRWRTPMPEPYWLAQPAAPGPPPTRSTASPPRTSRWSAAATAGLWTALIAKERDPWPRRRAASRRARPAGPRPAATAASARPASPTASPTGSSRWPGRDRHAAAARPGEPRRDRGGGRPVRHRLRLRAHRRAARGHRGLAVARCSSSPGSPPRRLAVSTWTCSTRTPYGRRWTRRPTRGAVWDRDGCAMVDPARLAWGLRARLPRPRACGSTRTRRCERSTDVAGRAGAAHLAGR